MYYKRITAQRPIFLEAGSKQGWGGGGQRKREDKAVVICLFNWLTCSEENCVVILALGLDGVQAPGSELAQCGAAGGSWAALHPGGAPQGDS